MEQCCHAVSVLEACESNVVVTRDAEGREYSRQPCAKDEQCFAFTEERAECRLNERCADPPAPPECRGYSLVYCAPGEAFLSRVNCGDRGDGKPGRCEPATTAGARCVDADAKPCQHNTCDGADKLLCKNGFTERWPACTSERDLAAGGTCRVNHEDQPVCAQPGAARCDPASYKTSHCQGEEIVSCRDGFIWRHPCPQGTTCELKQYGEENPTYLPVCR